MESETELSELNKNVLFDMQENFADFVSVLRGLRQQLADDGWDEKQAQMLVFGIIMNGLSQHNVVDGENEE